ncbi:hypothetical protein FOL47_002009 [Perkinsus chesapeaki]|uniref:C3H1-type domain-containing protein n=1 Tax=Perkinsus chesapeaki TaxID=330153 RepID=A0A7J6KQF6_PERCH|nr:hypothetical protein FOL47_002009 [Perkinsus chesapeaki]
MGGASWMFQRYSVALQLATVDPRENAAPKDVDLSMLQLAQEVDVRFRKFVSHAYLEATMSLRKLFDDSIKFGQIKLDCVSPPRIRSDNAYKAGASKNKRRFSKGLCYDFLAGKCRRGDNCKFMHSKPDSAKNQASRAAKDNKNYLVGGDIRALLMKAVLQAMQEETDQPLFYPFADLVDSGIPLGTTCDVPPTKMQMIGSNEVHRIQAVNRLACIPTYDDAGRLKRVRLVDDFRRSGTNSVIDPHLSQTLVLPTTRSVARTAQHCLLEAQARGDGSPLLWLESFCRQRCHLRPFLSTIKAARKKNLKQIWIGKALEQAAVYIGWLFESLCASPFNSLVPSTRCRRAIIMCDASTVALGGVT